MSMTDEHATELDAYVERLEGRSHERWHIVDLYYTGSWHRAIIVSESGSKRYLWFDYDGYRWRWDGCNSGWAGWTARQKAAR
jgi:hypothetical protein